MDDIEMKNRGDEPPPPEDRGEAETAFDDDREGRDNEVETNRVETNRVRWNNDKPGDDQNDELKRKLNKRIGVKERQKTSIKKEFSPIWVTELIRVTALDWKNFSKN